LIFKTKFKDVFENFLKTASQKDDYFKPLVTASAILGAFIGCLITSAYSDSRGRRFSLIIGAITSIVGNLVCMLSFRNFWVLATGRLIFGLSLGPISSIGPLYLSECSPVDMRGFLGTFFQFSITFTIFLAALWSFAVNKIKMWLPMLGLIFIPSLVLFAYALNSPESPRFLVGRDDEKAKELLLQFMKEEEAEEEIKIIKAKRNVKSKWSQIFTPANKRGLILGLVLAIAQQLTGINAIIYYYSTLGKLIFKKQNVKAIAASFSGIMLWNCITSMGAIPLTSKYGRKKLVLTGLATMFVSSLMTALFFLIKAFKLRNGLAIFSICTFILGFEIGIGPLFFVLINELFHESLRGRIGSLMTGIQWFLNFVLSISFPPLNNVISPKNKPPNGYVFFIFFGFGILSFLYLLFFLPETKGKTINEVQEALGIQTTEDKRPIINEAAIGA